MSRGTRWTETDESEQQQARNPQITRNPVALMAQMESELNDIRTLAIYRGRHYQSAIRRLDSLEEALLAMFEVRLRLMENIILRPQFAATSQSLLVPFAQRGRTNLGIRDLEDSLYFLKHHVRLLQWRVTNLRIPRRSRSGAAGSSRDSEQEPDQDDPGTVGYADILKRELEKIAQEETKKEMNSKGIVPAEVRRSTYNANVTGNRQPLRMRKSQSVPNKRSKFTC